MPAAADKAPGQMKTDGDPARSKAPGQTKDDAAQKSGDTKKSGELQKSDKEQSGSKDSDRTQNKASENRAPENKDSDKKSDDKAADTKGTDNKATDAGKAAETGVKSDAGKQAAGDGNKPDKAALANVAPETKTKVRTVFTKHRVEAAKNINVTINIGVSVPRTVRLYSVPTEVVTLVPAYRAYRYFLIDDRICIVDPDTFEIVDVIIIT
ncbi:MAG: DUF1236 domain-containing protein [Hyphomicrobiaceae bacterium]